MEIFILFMSLVVIVGFVVSKFLVVKVENIAGVSIDDGQKAQIVDPLDNSRLTDQVALTIYSMTGKLIILSVNKKNEEIFMRRGPDGFPIFYDKFYHKPSLLRYQYMCSTADNFFESITTDQLYNLLFDDGDQNHSPTDLQKAWNEYRTCRDPGCECTKICENCICEQN